ncbi:MAG: peptidylprolyl isomerase [Halieaceae bacterium]|jgi:hypothetical protein|uniref:peptidylprolyl isomerase n=1 Tax=Haliea alexandrii TaxID=2448162 RepID=UPI000F0B1B6D|nr:peptidylprolyl isomerase [Haliea alexandrii]MCR9186932.1 peptidylprolyl isomerase [Halieaceae bacterium]
MLLFRFLSPVVLLLGVALSAIADEPVAIADGETRINRAELEQVVARWSAEMRSAAANDLGDRMELLNIAMMNKRLAASADEATPETHGDDYWKLHFQLQGLKRRFAIEQLVKSIDVPDMSALAEERYTTDKDKFAFVPEKRLTSHILFVCPPGQCDRETVRPVAREVLAELRAGADFEALVAEHSQDPGSRDKGGRFDKWFSLGEKGVEPRYTGGAFDIAEVGGYSDLVETQFGVHIIRLDDIQPEHYLPFEEVRLAILQSLRAEYQKLAVQDFEAGLMISDEAYINGDIVDELLAPYKAEP